MSRIDIDRIEAQRGSSYPDPHDKPCRERIRKRLGDAGGLSDFGVNLLELSPGGWSSQRHWHSDEDEFVWIVRGEAVLVSDAGETILRAGDCAAFPKGHADGHHLVNRSSAPVICLEVGSRSSSDRCTYPDIDMYVESADETYRHRDGTPWDT